MCNKTENSSKIKTLWQEGVGCVEGRREMEDDSLLNSNWDLDSHSGKLEDQPSGRVGQGVGVHLGWYGICKI